MKTAAPPESPFEGKRVIVYAPTLLPPSETFIREQALALRGWRPTLVGDRILPEGLSLDGLDTFALRPAQDGSGLRLYKAFRSFGRPYPPNIRALRPLGASLVHAHFGTGGVEAWPLARAMSLPLLVTLHGFDITIRRDWWTSGQGGRGNRSYPDRLLALASEPGVHFAAVSKAILERAVAFGIPRRKVSLSYIGIDTGKFRPPGCDRGDDGKKILFVGRLVEKKGVEYLLKAFASVAASCPGAELTIAGDGPLRGELERHSAALAVPARFTGILPPAGIMAELAGAATLCVPSVIAGNGDSEGLPTVILEAQARGIPVVTSAQGGDEAVRHGITGFVFPECDVHAMASHLVALLQDATLRRRMGAEARNFVVRNFSMAECTRVLEDLYADCVAGPGVDRASRIR